MKTQKAGCILVNDVSKEIALVCREGEYSFPKGHLEQGEDLRQCAIRETIEETGHKCSVVGEKEIAIINYITPKGVDVEVHFYLAIDEGIYLGKINEEDKEETIWVDIDKVEETLSYQDLKDLWNSVRAQVKKSIC